MLHADVLAQLPIWFTKASYESQSDIFETSSRERKC